MNRDLTYTVPSDMAGHKISEFLHGKGFSRAHLTTLKNTDGSVLLHGLSVPMNFRLIGGEQIRVHLVETEISEKIPPVELPFPVVYEDEDILVVNKPANMPIHPSMKNYENTLGNAAAYYFAQKKQPFVYRCVNRLDKDTTGLTILAKHALSSSVLYDQITKHIVKRTYVAIAEGIGLPKEGLIDKPLGRKPDSAIERMVDYEQGERAVTHYRVIAENSNMGKGITLLQLSLETGRTHQIRVHMKSIGHPLIGDFLYNPRDTLMERQALHAMHLSFVHPVTGEELHFRAPLPEDMAKFFPANLDKLEAEY